MKKAGLIVAIMLAGIFASAATLIYEGFGYGDVTNFQNNVANPSAAGGIGFASDGWKQFNAAANGLVSVVGVGSIATPSGYTADKTNGFMIVNRGADTSSTWAIRNLASPHSMSADTVYYFCVVIRNNDNSSSGADASGLRLREEGTTRISIGFDNSEQLQIQMAGVTATGTDTNLFAKGNNVTLLGKLVLSSTGSDTLSVSAFKHNTATISGEPVSWDLSVSAELGTAMLDNIGLNVGSGNSRVDFDEIRMSTSFSDLIRPEPTLRLMIMH